MVKSTQRMHKSSRASSHANAHSHTGHRKHVHHAKRQVKGFLRVIKNNIKMATAIATLLFLGLSVAIGATANAAIQSKASGDTGRIGELANMKDQKRCVDVKDGVKKNGTMIRIWGCNSAKAQKATVDLSKNGHMTIKMMETSDWCIDIPDGKNETGTKLQLWPCNDAPAQEWVFYKNGNIMNPLTKKCIGAEDNDIAVGNELGIYPCSSNKAIRWFFPPSSVLIDKIGALSFKSTTAGGTSTSATKKLCINSAGDKQSLKTATCDTSNKSQKWSVVRINNGKRFKYMNGNNCLATINDDIESRACTNTKSQIWSIDSSSKLKNAENGKCLDTRDHRLGTNKTIGTFDCGTVKNKLNIPKYKSGDNFPGANGSSRPDPVKA